MKLTRLFRKTAKISLFLFLSLLPLCFFLFYTHTGLKFDLYLIKKATHNQLSIKKTEGSLSNNFKLTDISYTNKDFHIQLQQLNATLSPVKSLFNGITLKNMSVKQATIKLPKPKVATSKPLLPLKLDEQSIKQHLAEIQAPDQILKQAKSSLQNFKFDLTNIHIQQLNIIHQNQTTLLKDVIIDARSDGNLLEVKKFEVKSPTQNISLQGQIDFNSLNTTELNLRTTGAVKLNSKLSSRKNTHQLLLEIQKPFKAKAEFDVKPNNQIYGQVTIEKARWPLQGNLITLIPYAKLNIDSAKSSYQTKLELKLKAPELPLVTISSQIALKQNELDLLDFHLSDGLSDIEGNGQLSWHDGVQWQSHFEAKQFNLTNYLPSLPGQLNASLKSNGQIFKQQFQTQSQFTLNGNVLSQKLTGQGIVDSTTQKVQAQINLGQNQLHALGSTALPIKLSLDIPNLSTLHPLLQNLYAGLKGEAEINKESRFNFKLSSVRFLLEEAPSIYFQGGLISATMNPSNTQLQGKVTLSPSKHLSFQASLPAFGYQALEHQTIKANLHANFSNVKELESIITDLNNTHGQFIGTLSLTGLLMQPKVDLDLNLKNTSTQIPALNIELHQTNLHIKGASNDYQVSGSAISGNGKLNVSGHGGFRLPFEMKNALTLNGSNITLFNTDEYKIHASPNVTLSLNDDELFIDGSIKIDSAEVSPHDFSSTVELPEDVMILGQSFKPSKTMPIGYKLDIDIGEKAKLFVEGLKGNLQGQLSIDAPIHQISRATGSLNLLDATYKAYGQDLKVTEGKLIYAGGPLNNPSLLVRASRSYKITSNFSPNLNQSQNSYSDELTVGLNVSGRLKSPKVSLFSEPGNKSQADILSFLLLGKPLAQSSDPFVDGVENGSHILISALSALNLQGGSTGMQLTEQLKHAFGLDDLGIETQNTYNQDYDVATDTTSIVLGKSLSSRLSMHYSIGLAQGSNILKIKYQLNPWWAIQTETSTATNGVDILFNYHK